MMRESARAFVKVFPVIRCRAVVYVHERLPPKSAGTCHVAEEFVSRDLVQLKEVTAMA